MRASIQIRNAINKPLSKFATEPYRFFVSPRISSRRDAVSTLFLELPLRNARSSEKRRRKRRRGGRKIREAKRRFLRAGGAGGREREVGGGGLAVLAERTERAMKYDSAILQRQPPPDVSGGVGSRLMWIQWSTVVAGYGASCASLFCTAPCRARRASCVPSSRYCGDGKNLSAMRIGTPSASCLFVATQNERGTLIRRRHAFNRSIILPSLILSRRT